MNSFELIGIRKKFRMRFPYACFLLFLLYGIARQPILLVILALFILSQFLANALEHIHLFSMTVNSAIEEVLKLFGATMLLLVLIRCFAIEYGRLG